MPDTRVPLFIRLPRSQADALDRLADSTGRPKQTLVSELLGERLPGLPRQRPMSVGRVELLSERNAHDDEVLTLDEAAALLKLPADALLARAEAGDLPGRRFAKEWRFARSAVLAWLAEGEPQKRGSVGGYSRSRGGDEA